MNPTLYRAATLAHIAKKVESRIERIGFMCAEGTQAVCRCNGVAMRIQGRTIIETGECAIVAPISESAILRWREYVN